MKSIFDKDFYPTPPEVIEMMISSLNVSDKVILEPSAGSGNIVDHLKALGAEVIACEKDPDLAKIVANKCNLLANDFFTVEAHQVSHIHMIIMNPPFSCDERHILHAWNLAPAGCKIVSLCNSSTVNERNYYSSRRELGAIIDEYGSSTDLGDCFSNADRPTKTEVSMITLNKPGGNYEAEFDGFFLEDDPAEHQENALMPYNFVRDIVNRYIGAVKIYDEQLTSAVKLNGLLSGFYGESMAFQCKENGRPKLRNEFKKGLQKAAWSFVFRKMDLTRHSTTGLRADINKFVEQNQKIPFTMRNIYRMLDIVIGTTEQRMDKALLEVFEKVTKHYDENRFNLEGWKTNSHYLLNRKFIMPNVVTSNYRGTVGANYYGWAEPIDDLSKAICYLTGVKYEQVGDFSTLLRDHNVYFGELSNWGFFQFRAYKKGTVHLTFISEDVWAKFNQRIAKLLGYPLPEAMKPKEQAKAKQEPKASEAKPKATKEPWEITLAEFIKPYSTEKSIVLAKAAHLAIIKQALSSGKIIPSEVMADYPELQDPSGDEEALMLVEDIEPEADDEPDLIEVYNNPDQLVLFEL